MKVDNPMCVSGTPVEHYPEFGLYVKREDLSCPAGPHFSKTRGVYAHISKRPENVIGCLDTSHSQGGWATARACEVLEKRCLVYYPETKKMRENNQGPHPQQMEAWKLGAGIIPLQAGRSAVIYHQAKKHLAQFSSDHPDKLSFYMMPNALKLPEMIEETVAEVLRTPIPPVDVVIISASSGTIAAGVISGLCQKGYNGGVIVHQGYTRTESAIRSYMAKMVSDYSNSLVRSNTHPGGRLWTDEFSLIDEGYEYGDKAALGPNPYFPCNAFYDLKAFRWWVTKGRKIGLGNRTALLWNIG